jgi:SAM-dependent methyltransferase
MRYNAAELRDLYRDGLNISEFIRSQENSSTNTSTVILYAYDVQAGSYTANLRNQDFAAHKAEVGRKLAAIIDQFDPESILDAGIGEATTTVPILAAMHHKPRRILGLDLSLSRLLYARRYLSANGFSDARLFTGDLENIPLPDGAVDVVVTVHAVEPNHGREEAILRELIRVARRALVMVEPSWEFGSAGTRARIERLGYVQNLADTLESLGHSPSRFEKWGLDINPDNEAALIVVAKPAGGSTPHCDFVSPISRQPLLPRPDCWFCPMDGHAFPVIAGIPCLTVDGAVPASKLAEF